MERLKHQEDALLQRIQKHGCVLMLDFDGVLSPIVARPQDARISPRALEAIKACRAHIPVAIISGRSLADVKRKAGIRGIAYAGSHGTEWTFGGRVYRKHPDARSLEALQHARTALRPLARRFPGVIGEKKHHGFTCNYRGLTATAAAEFRREARRLLKRTPHVRHLRVMDNLFTLDISAATEWSKGECAWLLYKKFARGRAVPVFIGDSLTDEDAFRALESGITIRVGRSAASAAKYYVRTRDEVDAFLGELAQRVA